jgi:ABC-type sugar transport system ATPase subunit
VLDGLAAEGRALVVVSSDLQELVEISDRILVFLEGRIVDTFEGPRATYEAVSAACIAGPVPAAMVTESGGRKSAPGAG